MSPCLFVSDLDGTLFTDERTLSRENLSCLGELQKKGISTAIATGRSSGSFFHAITRAMNALGKDMADFPAHYLIFSTGAGIMELGSGKLMRACNMTRHQAKKVCAYFDARQMDYMAHKAIPDSIYFEYKSHGQNNPDFEARLKFHEGFGLPMKDSGPGFEELTQVLAVLPEPMSLELVEKMRSDLPEYSVIHTTSPLDKKSQWIEVFTPEVCKSNACQWLADHLAIDPEQVIAVGNDYNDEDMLSWAGQKFLVSNGPAPLQKRFPLTDSNNNNGVAKAAVLAGLISQ